MDYAGDYENEKPLRSVGRGSIVFNRSFLFRIQRSNGCGLRKS
jgi:hypothetical protein